MNVTGPHFALEVRADDLRALNDLVDLLRDGGCDVEWDGETTLLVAVPEADAVETEVELRFLVGAWKLRFPTLQLEVVGQRIDRNGSRPAR